MPRAAVKETIESAAEHYWGGIKELVEKYFSRPRPMERNIYWIKVTLYKEIKAVPKILAILGEQYPQLDRKVDRTIYEGLAYELADEIKHYRLLADAFEWLTGGKVCADECSPSPEQIKLEELRKTLAPDLGLVPHVNVAHETVFASVMKRISGGELEKRVARAYGQVYSDEVKHYSLGWKELSLKNLEPGQLERLVGATQKVARQYLVMRNELFGNVLSEKRLQEIDRRKVEPYRPH